MKKHPQETVAEVIKERSSNLASSMKQRVADATSAVQSKLPSNVWSIRIPKVYVEGTPLAYGEFVHLMFVSGTKEEARRVAKIVTDLPEQAPERPNWRVEVGVGEEFVIQAQKFIPNNKR